MADTTARYRDDAAPIEERVDDLITRMTLDEKIVQLGGIWAFELVSGDRLRPERLDERLAHGIGEITRLAGSTNLRPIDVARVHNEIQTFLVERTRLGIPAIVHEECLHGLLAWAAPSFQQAIGAAATFDPALLADVAGTIRRRMLATGARHALAPVLDIARDARWGRIEETYGEDPYLAAAMGIAYIRALQGPDAADGIIATAKHLVGHGLAEGGLNQAPAHVGWRELRDEQLLPFEAAVRDAQVASVMPAYGDVDAVPCHMSRELLDQVLRGEWGFEGIVASDYMGIEQIVNQHRLTDDLGVAARLALEAGVDLELPRPAAYAKPLADAVAAGEVDIALVDTCVRRVLRAKFELGLFERPLVPIPDEGMLAELAADERRVGRELVRRSLVLLENDGVLPLQTGGRRVAVIGPIADSARDLLGDYSHLLHIETLVEIRSREVLTGIDVGEDVSVDDELVGRRTILDALQERLAADTVVHVQGTAIHDGTDEDMAAAVAAARDADVAILVLGERSGLTEDATTGEFRDRRELGFIGRQQELLEAVVATGTPVVLVVVSGRPLALDWASRHCAAILLAWVPGDEGPDVIAEALLGVIDPGGKLPVSMPRHVGQVPLTYRHRPSGGRSNPRGDRVDGPTSPLWPFGFGRSFTSFALSDLVIEGLPWATDGDVVRISATVANTGDRAGDEVVQLYVRDEEAGVARPIIELAGFQRVRLDPGERATVTFELHPEFLAYTGADYRRIVEPGHVTISLGTSSADRPLAATVDLVGPTVTLPSRRRFVTPAQVVRASRTAGPTHA